MEENNDFIRFTGKFKPQLFNNLIDQEIVINVEGYHIIDFIVTSFKNTFNPEIFHMESTYAMDGKSEEPCFTKSVYALDSEGRISHLTYPKRTMKSETFYTIITQEYPDFVDTRMHVKFEVRFAKKNIPCTMDVYDSDKSSFILEVQSKNRDDINAVTNLPLLSSSEKTEKLMIEKVYSPVVNNIFNADQVDKLKTAKNHHLSSDALIAFAA